MANTIQPTAKITYNGSAIANLFGGQTATVKCGGMKMETDLTVEVAESKLDKHIVRFYNGTTLLQADIVKHGGDVFYTGDTPVSSENASYEFLGWDKDTTNVTSDLDCYALYAFPSIPETLDECSWAEISAISAEGTAADYFAVGDTKAVALNGTVGTITLNDTYYVYILGFDHNSEIEGNGITFGTFKTAKTDGKNISLKDTYDKALDGTKAFTINHWGENNVTYNHGGWAGCDMRYDILGSTDIAPSGYAVAITSGRVGYDASPTCATNPVANTLMAAFPVDLRTVIKPITKYTDNVGGSENNTESKVTRTIDYLPLLSEFEVYGTISISNDYEKTKQAQYTYYSAGNSPVKYKHSSPDDFYHWWLRSPKKTHSSTMAVVQGSGKVSLSQLYNSMGLAPIFLV